MNTSHKIRNALDRLGYDFMHFEVADFVRHVEVSRGKDIVVHGLPLSREISAMLIRAETADYIICNKNLHSVQQTHSILHEIAHLVLEHPGRPLNEILSPELMAQMPLSNPTGHLRIAKMELRETPEEREAEAFVMLIQEKLVEARRLEKLMEPSSSIQALRPWIDGVWKIG